ncbi:carbohydrate binding domain-containing protein [bacterium]|nr:carbohydrate binding domain-containing protein [bacterium]
MALIDKASLLMVPSTYEAGKLYNVLPSGNRAPDSTGENSGYDQTRADFDFDRGSNTAATRVNADGLIEKYRENLLTYSRTFSSNWTTTNVSVTSGQSGYDGSDNAVKVTADANGSINLQQGLSFANVNTFSVYLKAGNVDFAKIFMVQDGANRTAVFDLVNGTIAQDNNGDIPATITSINNGWYRCSISANSTNGSVVRVRSQRIEGDDNVLAGDYIFVQDAQLETGLVATDVLTSGATTGKAGLLIDLPRIDYSSGAGALLLEPSRQQLVQFSEYLSTFGGTATINDNAIISPEGLQNAAEVILSASGTDSFYKEVAVTANTKYTLSFYVKQGSNTNNQLAVRDQTNATFIATDVSYTASSTEWKRIEYTFTTPAGCVEARIYPHRSSLSSVGNGYFYGIQVEAGSYATSYIPNHGESGGVTRAADSCSVTGASDVIGQTEGTLFYELKSFVTTADSSLFIGVSDGTSDNRVLIGPANAANRIRVVCIFSGVSNNGNNYLVTDITTYNKVAVKYNSSSVDVFINGVKQASQTGGSFSRTLDDSTFDNGTGQNYFIGNIKQRVHFNEALSDAECISLTS